MPATVETTATKSGSKAEKTRRWWTGGSEAGESRIEFKFLAATANAATDSAMPPVLKLHCYMWRQSVGSSGGYGSHRCGYSNKRGQRCRFLRRKLAVDAEATMGRWWLRCRLVDSRW